MKYGWEIADEVQRFVGNSADIQFVTKADYDDLKAKYQKAVEAIKFATDDNSNESATNRHKRLILTLAELGEKE